MSKNPQKWLAEHEDELPHENDGLRIHGDPIMYMGKQPPDYLRQMQCFPRVLETADAEVAFEQVRMSPLYVAICALIDKSGISPLGFNVFVCRMGGFTIRQIAKSLSVSSKTVCMIEYETKCKLKSCIHSFISQ